MIGLNLVFGSDTLSVLSSVSPLFASSASVELFVTCCGAKNIAVEHDSPKWAVANAGCESE